VQKGISVFIAIMEPLLADGIANAIMASEDLQVVARPSNRRETITQIGKLQPRAAIIDFSLLEPAPFQAIRQIKQASPDVAIIILTSKTTPSCVLRSFEAGVAGYLLKKASASEVLSAIRSVCAGEAVADMHSITECLAQVTSEPSYSRAGQHLGVRELEVLKLASKGLTNKEIAEKLFVSQRTVESHFNAIFGKLGVGSRTEAVLMAWRNNWITNEDVE
jgi:DNA-binding NarL/FixJ family response regulator